MAVNFASKFMDQLNPFDMGTAAPQHKRSSWQPIQYTSMFWWWCLNYTLLACMIALPATIGYGLWELIR